jgi:NTP pyrophosphatase (non-canonical NTP hydrolase)
MELSDFQETIRRTYLSRDAARGVDGTFRWLAEEVGELARTIRHQDRDQRVHETGDVLAWLASVANLLEVDLEEAAERYAKGCPRCGSQPCACPAA